jgi:hypothetical protein
MVTVDMVMINLAFLALPAGAADTDRFDTAGHSATAARLATQARFFGRQFR